MMEIETMRRTSRSSKQSQPGTTKPARRASAPQIVDLLSRHPFEIYKALGLEPADAHLSMPTDSRGARIRASVKGSKADSVPTQITLPVGERLLSIPIEVAADFQEFQPLVSG